MRNKDILIKCFVEPFCKKIMKEASGKAFQNVLLSYNPLLLWIKTAQAYKIQNRGLLLCAARLENFSIMECTKLNYVLISLDLKSNFGFAFELLEFVECHLVMLNFHWLSQSQLALDQPCNKRQKKIETSKILEGSTCSNF